MTCAGKVVSQRDGILAKFAAGRRGERAAFRQRLAICCRGTECGRLCENLVKGPGKALVWCTDLETGAKVSLYPSLADADFRCPRNLF